MRAAGGAGEIVGWIHDEYGRHLEIGSNPRNAGVRVDPPTDNLVVASAVGPVKVRTIRAVISGKFFNGLGNDEATETELLS